MAEKTDGKSTESVLEQVVEVETVRQIADIRALTKGIVEWFKQDWPGTVFSDGMFGASAEYYVWVVRRPGQEMHACVIVGLDSIAVRVSGLSPITIHAEEFFGLTILEVCKMVGGALAELTLEAEVHGLLPNVPERSK